MKANKFQRTNLRLVLNTVEYAFNSSPEKGFATSPTDTEVLLPKERLRFSTSIMGRTFSCLQFTVLSRGNARRLRL